MVKQGRIEINIFFLRGIDETKRRDLRQYELTIRHVALCWSWDEQSDDPHNLDWATVCHGLEGGFMIPAGASKLLNEIRYGNGVERERADNHTF